MKIQVIRTTYRIINKKIEEKDKVIAEFYRTVEGEFYIQIMKKWTDGCLTLKTVY